MAELYGPDWTVRLTLQEADEGRPVGARRLREAESRREDMLRADSSMPALEDLSRPRTGALPPVPMELTPNSESQSPAPEPPGRPLTPRARSQPTEPPPRPTSSARQATSVPPPVGGESSAYMYGVQLGSKALKPHDASKENYEAYVKKLE